MLQCVALAALASAGTSAGAAAQNETLRLDGLHEPVEIIRDRWAIAHIYAGNEHDLFFAQGYTAASDSILVNSLEEAVPR